MLSVTQGGQQTTMSSQENDLYDFISFTLPQNIGVGTFPTTTSTSTIPSGIGVGTSSVTSAPVRATPLTARTVSAGKQPRTPAGTRGSSRRRRHVRQAETLRRAPIARAGGDVSTSDSSDNSGRQMHNDLDQLLQRLRRRTGGKHIAGITHTDTITTTYKDGRPPTVSRSSTRSSGTSTG